MPTWNRNQITNPFFSLALEPRHGGRIISLETASGSELTVGATPAQLNRTRVPERFGLLSLQLWQESYWHNDINHLEWPITNTSVTPARVVVSLAGQSVVWPGVSVERHVSVTDDPWIDVEHNLNPGLTTRSYAPPAFWFSNVLRGRGRTFVPSPIGVLDLPRWPQDQSWCHEPIEGWMAWLDQTDGLAFVTDPAHLRHVRVSHHRTDRVEWIRRRVATTERTTVRLIPFTGLSRVDGVGEAGIVALESSPTALELHLYVLRSGRANIEVQLIETGGVVETLFTAMAQVQAGSVKRMRIAFPSDGTTAWRGRLIVDYGQGPFTTDFTGPATRPHSGVSRLRGDLPSIVRAVERPRLSAANRRPPRRFMFDAIPTPLPDPWVPRDRANRLRVLALTHTAATESTIALAHRFDLDMTLLYVPRGAAIPTGNNGITGQSFRIQLGDRYEGFTGDEVIDIWVTALDPARQYDVILLGIGRQEEEGWALLPQTLQAEILNRVQAGTGLVTVRSGAPSGPNPETATLTGLLPLLLQSTSDFSGSWRPSTDPTVQGLPWDVMASPGRIMEYSVRPGAQTLLEINITPTVRQPVAARTNYGSGRVLELGWGPYTVPVDRYRVRPAGTELMDMLRYDQALLARFLYDTAGRVPPIAVRNVSVSGNTATIELNATTTPTPPFDMDWVARDRFGVVLSTGRETPASFPANGLISLAIPSGTWTVDATVIPQMGDLAWGAGGRTLDFGITVSPNLTVMNPADAVVVTVPTPVVGATLYVIDTVDGRGRVVARTKASPTTGSEPVSAGSLDTPYAEFRVHALDMQGQLIAQAVRRFRLRRRSGLDGWPVHFWNWQPLLPQPLLVRHFDTNASLGVWTLRALGDDSLDSDIAASADRINMPYGVSASSWIIVRGGTAPDGTPIIGRNGQPVPQLSLTDAARIAAGRADDAVTAANLADGNILFYLIGDQEPRPPRTDASHDLETLARFQIWLRELYGHTESLLQQEWGPTASLASATPRSFADAVAAFPAELTYAPWLDFRRFIMDLFSRIPALSREALQRGDANARIVTTGDSLMAMASGRDWWVRGRALDIVGRYAVSTAFELEALGTPSMAWTGYDDPDPVIRYRFWNAFGLRESGQALFSEATLVNPDLSLPEVGRDLAAALLSARRGVGGLFMVSQPAADGIYVLTSPDSSCVLAIHGYESVGAWISGSPPARPNNLGYDTREGVHDLLAAMGVGWRAISSNDIETGALERNRARLLILPLCVALSDAACEAIRRWVERGGLVIADLMPAVFSAHGRLRGTGITATGGLQGSTNPLDAVFGLTPGARPPIANTTVTVSGVQAFASRCADTALVASTAFADGTTGGGAPVWFSNQYGQGQATYLGCALFADYLHYSPTSRTDRARMETAFLGLLHSMGVTERVAVTDPAGQQRATLCQFRLRELGSTELVVLLRYYLGIYDPVEPETVGELEFRNAAHTYDIEAGAYLGYGRRLPIHLSAYTHRAFARLPYKVTGIDLQLQTHAALGNRIVMTAAVRVENGFACNHYLRLDVLDQNGRVIRYLAREAMAECGEATFVIQTALNDPPGIWTFIVVDVATGVQSQVQIDMRTQPSLVPQPEPFLIEAIDD